MCCYVCPDVVGIFRFIEVPYDFGAERARPPSASYTGYNIWLLTQFSHNEPSSPAIRLSTAFAIMS